MPKEKIAFIRFNGGETGKDINPLVDLEKYPATASIMENWVATVQGEMHFRSGLEWRSSVADAGLAVLYPFIFSASQRYGVRFTSGRIRILQDGDVIVRLPVDTTIPGGTFNDLSDWTDISTGTSEVAAENNELRLTSNGTEPAGVRQEITIATPATQHAINLRVSRGPVTLRVGTEAGGFDILNVRARTGFHTLAFTPTTPTVWIEIVSTDRADRFVSYIEIAGDGDMIIETPYLTEESFRNIAYVQSADVMFLVNGLHRPQRLERRGVSSWSLVDMDIVDGPFETSNLDESITITPDVVLGNGTMTASQALWTPQHKGALWQLTHSGQRRNRSMSTAGVFTEPILVQGAGAARNFTYKLSGTFDAKLTLQRSVGNTVSWVDVEEKTEAGSYSLNDELDNQIAYYRIGIKTGDYTSGAVTAELFYEGGTTVGVVRITDVVDPVTAKIEVVSVLGDTTETYQWAEGSWSDALGWPNAIAEHDERMYFGNIDRFKGSVAGAYESHDAGTGGDSDAIARRVRGGPISWIVPLARLLVGTEAIEHSVRSSAFEEPITPSNLTIRPLATVGSAKVQPVVVDTRAIFIDRSGSRIYEILYSIEQNDYITRDISELHKKIGRPSIIQMAVQRQPDPRVYMVRSDGQCVVLLFDPKENVMAWGRLVTKGAFESVMVLPGQIEDEVYFNVRRVVNGNTVRFTERLAPFEVDDAADSCYADSFIKFDGAPRTTLAVPHLEGEEVVIWADGAYHPPKKVTGGIVTFERPVSKGMVGLYYDAPYQSQRIHAGAGAGMTDLKRPYHMAMVLRDSTPYLKFGTSFDQMELLNDRTILDQYDSGPGLRDITTKPAGVFGRHTTDPRLCLLAEAPYGPVIVQGLIPTTQMNVKG